MAADRTDATPAVLRPLTSPERDQLRTEVEGLAWEWARRLGATAPRPAGNHDRAVDAAAARAIAEALQLIAGTADTWAMVRGTAARYMADTDPRPAPAAAEWTREQVLAYLAEAGTPVAADTWSAYVSRGQAPAPARRVGRTPVWDPVDVRAWQADRRGRGWRAGAGDARALRQAADALEVDADDIAALALVGDVYTVLTRNPHLHRTQISAATGGAGPARGVVIEVGDSVALDLALLDDRVTTIAGLPGVLRAAAAAAWAQRSESR